jgi:hypothetical protein
MAFKFKKRPSETDDEIRPGAYEGERVRDGLFGPRGMDVEDSEELQRVLAIPRRPPVDLDSLEARIIVERQTAKLRRDRGGAPCECHKYAPDSPCITELLPVQAVSLREISMARGLWGSIVVGGGKSLIGILAMIALEGSKQGLLLVPPQLMKQIFRQWQLYSQHWRVPKIIAYMSGGEDLSRESPTGEAQILRVMSHNGISSPKSSDFMERIKPDVIIIDEQDAFADLTSARTIRLVRYMRQYGERTEFIGMTGSPMDQKIEEAAHLMAYALKKRSPMPIATSIVQQWGTAINAVGCPAPPGALMQLVGPEDDGDDDTALVRAAFRRRLEETVGVVMTSSADVRIEGGDTLVKIEVHEREAPELPPIIHEALELVRSGERPDTLVGNDHGEIFADPKEQVRCAREVACGMFYRWVFPRRETREVRDTWFKVRKSYNAEMRALIMQGHKFLDSPKLCEDAARRYYGQGAPDPSKPVWASKHWLDWLKVRDTVKPQTAACRLHDYLVRDAIEWAAENKGIIWYSTVELAEWIAELSGLPVYAGGPDAEDQIERLIRSTKPIGSVVASMNSHGRGRDGLQNRFANQLILNVPSSSKRNQQLYARLHRRGQKADKVRSWIYVHTKELRSAHMQALRRSEFVEAVLGQRQKLRMGLD